MTSYTIGASVVLAKILDESRPDWVDEVATAARRGQLHLVSPTLLWVEIGNRLVRRDMRDEHALEAMLRVDALDIEAVELHRPVRLRAMHLAREHELTMYDATYLAVAEVTGTRVLTLDRDLDEAAIEMGLGRTGPRRISEPRAPYGDDRSVDRTSLAVIGAAIADMRREYSR